MAVLEQPAIEYRLEPVAVIDDAAAAEVSLDPMRARLLAALAEPGSASTLAAAPGWPGRRSTTTCARWSGTA